jgi:hypothetical protein
VNFQLLGTPYRLLPFSLKDGSMIDTLWRLGGIATFQEFILEHDASDLGLGDVTFFLKQTGSTGYYHICLELADLENDFSDEEYDGEDLHDVEQNEDSEPGSFIWGIFILDNADMDQVIDELTKDLESKIVFRPEPDTEEGLKIFALQYAQDFWFDMGENGLIDCESFIEGECVCLSESIYTMCGGGPELISEN